jgi:hypothetical protein
VKKNLNNSNPNEHQPDAPHSDYFRTTPQIHTYENDSQGGNKHSSDRGASVTQSAKEVKKKSLLASSSSSKTKLAASLKQTMLVKPPAKKTVQSSNAAGKTASQRVRDPNHLKQSNYSQISEKVMTPTANSGAVTVEGDAGKQKQVHYNSVGRSPAVINLGKMATMLSINNVKSTSQNKYSDGNLLKSGERRTS